MPDSRRERHRLYGSYFGSHTMDAPWGVGSRKELAVAAIEFFGANEDFGEDTVTLTDFLNHLRTERKFDKTPNAHRVHHILERMVEHGLLSRVMQSRFGSVPFLYSCYQATDLSSQRRRGEFRLCSTLGPEFLFLLMKQVVVHIVGKNKDGDCQSGTGLVLDENHVLTCRHVVCDMVPNCRQTFQGIDCIIEDIKPHPDSKYDIAVIQVSGPLNPLDGILFQSPVVAQTVYTLGYPLVPYSRTEVLAIHQGAVTCESFDSFDLGELFMYSAITRPGNSGGPVVSDDGYVVGMSVIQPNMDKDSLVVQKYADGVFLPHHAGIGAGLIVDLVAEIAPNVRVPFEERE